jgi:hypothetical protein
MRPVFLPILSIALLCATLPASAAIPVRHKIAPPHANLRHTRATPQRVSAHSHFKAAGHIKATKPAAHVAMDTERATQIQTALIKSGYLSGEASGNWDAQSMAAMQKLQSDNGWQTKIVPDSRALIKLGLGPTGTAKPN